METPTDKELIMTPEEHYQTLMDAVGVDLAEVFSSREAIIFKPANNAMQNMPYKEREFWVLKFLAARKDRNLLMGWEMDYDIDHQLEFKFPDQASAERFAKDRMINYTLRLPKVAKRTGKAYATNFKWKGKP